MGSRGREVTICKNNSGDIGGIRPAQEGDSRGDLAGLRRATQGGFQILPRDPAPGLSEQSRIEKTVRIVSTIEYLLR